MWKDLKEMVAGMSDKMQTIIGNIKTIKKKPSGNLKTKYWTI